MGAIAVQWAWTEDVRHVLPNLAAQEAASFRRHGQPACDESTRTQRRTAELATEIRRNPDGAISKRCSEAQSESVETAFDSLAVNAISVKDIIGMHLKRWSHLSEQVQVVAADRQYLASTLQMDMRGLVFTARHVADRAQVDHNRTVHLHEMHGVKLNRQLL